MTQRAPFTRIGAAALALVVVGIAVAVALVLTSNSRRSHSRSGVAPVAWPAPALHDPQVIHLTSANTNLKLSDSRDYVLELPRDTPLQAPAGLTIAGGHNVVMVGGTINVPGRSGAGLLENQTGTVHIEGVRFTGPQLMEGLDLSEPDGATVELENIYFATVHGSYTTNHADLIQSWAGPKRLLVDGLVGSTQYQGFFLLPNQHDPGPPPQLFDLRNVYINDSGGAYALWLQTTPAVPLHVSDVSVTPNQARTWRGWWLWPKPLNGDATWRKVRAVQALPPEIRRQATRAGLAYPRFCVSSSTQYCGPATAR